MKERTLEDAIATCEDRLEGGLHAPSELEDWEEVLGWLEFFLANPVAVEGSYTKESKKD